MKTYTFVLMAVLAVCFAAVSDGYCEGFEGIRFDTVKVGGIIERVEKVEEGEKIYAAPVEGGYAAAAGGEEGYAAASEGGYLEPDWVYYTWADPSLMPFEDGFERIMSFKTPGWTSYDNLMKRVNHKDGTGLSDVPIPKQFNEVLLAGLVEEAPGEWYEWRGGYANNNNYYSNRFPDLLSGWLDGGLSLVVFTPGKRVCNFLLVCDPDGDGIAVWYEPHQRIYVNAGEFPETEDNEAYLSKDVLFGHLELRGDIGEFPPTVWGENNILPKMIICPYEDYDALYRDRKRVDLAGLPDFIHLGENWLTEGCSNLNFHGQGSDWNLDGEINLKDFALMAKNWNPNEAAAN